MMSRRTLRTAFGIAQFFALAGLLACTASAAATQTPNQAPSGKPAEKTEREVDRKPAPALELTDAEGRSIKLAEYRGKVVLLNFWATWCHGCQTEIPWFIEFENKYKTSGLTAIGVSMDDDGWKSVKPWIAQKKVNYPIVIGSDEIGKRFGVGNMPKTLLIDRNGNIAEIFDGVVDHAACERKIRALLGERMKLAAK
jgi:peroxiredoxin